MLVRIFLAVTGLLYLYLGVWCAVSPAKTSETVGLDIKPGSGQSEWLTVYGGLELGLGLILLLPAILNRSTREAVIACLIIHACLVLTRSIGFALYSGIATPTYKLAAGEWVIFLLSAALWWKSRV
jgi:hypothetical protein